MIVDEAGESDDWVEVRNTGSETVSLDGLGLAESTSPEFRDIMQFPAGTTLAPGEYLIVWADNDVEQGPLHAPFKLSGDGEVVALIGITDRGATAVASGLEWPALEAGEAFAAVGIPGNSIARIQAPTPRMHNHVGDAIELLAPSEPGAIDFIFPTGDAGSGAWSLEMSGSMQAGTWQPVESGTFGGVERIYRVPVAPGGRQFYRARTQPAGTGNQ